MSYAAWKLLSSVWECLALTNQVTFERGFHRALSETDRFANRPAKLDELVDTIGSSPDVDRVLEAADELTAATYRVLHDREPAQPARRSISEGFDQAYPEMKDVVRKLLTACEAGDYVAASLEAHSLQSDITSMLADTQDGPIRRRSDPYGEHAAAYEQVGFPDLMALSSGSLGALADAARRFDEKLRSWLGSHSVGLCEFATLRDLRDALR